MPRRTSLRRAERRLQQTFRRIVLSSMALPPLGAGAGCAGDSVPGVVIDLGVPLRDLAPDWCQPYGVQIALSTPDAGGECGVFAVWPCGMPAGVSPRDDCYFPLNDCTTLCDDPRACFAFGSSCSDGGVVPDGPFWVECFTCIGSPGRRPDGLEAPAPSRARHPLGDYFARCAHLEAAAVQAFRILGEELVQAGAPPSLRRAAHRAARDEVRHASDMARLGRRYGASSVPRVVVKERPAARSLEAMAVENAVEGCVGETFAALLALAQAERAADPEVRRVMTRIAGDETRHAAVSWEVHRFLAARLDAAARRRVDEAFDEARRSLVERSGGASPSPAEQAIAGLPDQAGRRRLVAALDGHLWQQRERLT